MKNKNFFPLLFILWIVEPLFLWALGTCEIQVARPVTLISLGVRYLFFTAGLHVLLVGPLIYFAYPDLKRIKVTVLRQWVLFLFLALPLLSMGYFLGNFKHSGAFFEWVFPCSVLLIISVVVFEKTQKLSLLTWGLSTGVFAQWFVMADILGPFPTYWQIIPKNDSFYWLKNAMAIVLLTLALTRVRTQRKVDLNSGLASRVMTLTLWMFLGLGIYCCLPPLLGYFEKGITLHLSWLDFAFCLFPPLILGEVQSRWQTSKIWNGFKFFVALVFALRASMMVLNESASAWAMSWVAYDSIAAILIVLSIEKRSLEFKIPVTASE